MAAETDLSLMLGSLSASRREGNFTFVTIVGEPPLAMRAEAAAVVEEAEGTTLVVPVEIAAAHGWDVDFVAAWLTLDVHSALESVGLTAAVARTLAAEGIACNVIAGFHHDHLVVPVERADDAIAAVAALRGRS